MNKSKARKLSGCLYIVIALAAVLCVVPIGGFFLWSRSATRKVNELVAEIRDQGHPASYSEVDEYYESLPGSMEATRLWSEILVEVRRPTFWETAKPLPVVGDGPSDLPAITAAWPEQPQVAAFLESLKPTLEKVHKASRLGPARFKMDFREGLKMPLSDAQDLRAVIRLLRLQGQLQVRQGNHEAAAAAIVDTLRTGDALASQPVVVSQLVRLASHGVATQMVEELVPHMDLSDQQLAELQDEFTKLDYRQTARQSLLGERVIGIELMSKQSMMISGSDLGLYLELMADSIDALEETWPESLDQYKKIDDRVARLTASPDRWRYPQTLMIFPALSTAARAAARADGNAQLSAALIAIVRFQRAEGKSPQGWNELVPKYLAQTPIDPFDGQPMRFLVSGSEIVIYSIGQDGKDDGGKGRYGDPDVALRVPIDSAP